MNTEVETLGESEILNNIDYLIYINLAGDKTIINAPIGINIQDMLILLNEKKPDLKNIYVQLFKQGVADPLKNDDICITPMFALSSTELIIKIIVVSRWKHSDLCCCGDCGTDDLLFFIIARNFQTELNKINHDDLEKYIVNENYKFTDYLGILSNEFPIMKLKLKHSHSTGWGEDCYYITNAAFDNNDDDDEYKNISYEDITYQTYIDKLVTEFPTYLSNPGIYVYSESFNMQKLS